MTFWKLDRIGIPGVVGAGLILFCLAFYLGSVGPDKDRLAERKREEARLVQQAAGARAATDDASATRSAASALPPITEAPELLKAIDELAEKHGIVVERAAYVLSEQNGRRRMEIKLPMKGSYLPLRAYLREVQTLTPSATLDELNLQRKDATEPVVEATVRLSFHFAQPSAS